jgi:hypothetical protein
MVDSQTISPTIAVDKVKDAASAINEIIERIIAVDGIKFFGPMTVSLLPPAMQVHLVQSKLGKPLARQLASTKLDVCLMALAELRDNYPSSVILHELFNAAKLADTPISNLMPDSLSPASAPVSITSVAVSDAAFPSGLIQESQLLLDNAFPLADFALFPPLHDVWQADADLIAELSLHTMLGPDELEGIFG